MRTERLRKTKRVLEASRTELLDRLAARKDLGAERPAEELEEAQLAAERDMAVRNLDNGTRRLREIDAALRRLEEGAYGICIRCEEKIGEKRLAALPWSALCLSCQEASERERDGGGGAVTGARPAPPVGSGSAESLGF